MDYDLWTGLGQSEFGSITAHFFDKKWVLTRLTLDLFYFPEKHTGANIFSKLQQLGEKWGGRPFQVLPLTLRGPSTCFFS
jgi:hypothetical protein